MNLAIECFPSLGLCMIFCFTFCIQILTLRKETANILTKRHIEPDLCGL